MKKKTKKEKMRDLLCFALNKLIEEKIINLSTPSATKEGYFQTEILGYQSVITWSEIGYQELRISIWWGIEPQIPLSSSTQPLVKYPNKFVKVYCSGWVERKDGKWLQGKGGEFIFDTYCSNTALSYLLNIPLPITLEYHKEGRGYC